MLSTTLQEAAIAFGLALRQAPAVAALRSATAALEADPTAQQLLADLRGHQLALARVQQSGLLPAQEQIDALRLCQAAVRTNLTIMNQLRATNDVKAYLPGIAGRVSEALGTDYAALIAPTSC
ncbi:MAG: YlbF family regulator [Chloroflexi bacterium]|nr:YlbF family regulator [Chloroflexota bacterium]